MPNAPHNTLIRVLPPGFGYIPKRVFEVGYGYNRIMDCPGVWVNTPLTGVWGSFVIRGKMGLMDTLPCDA